MSKTNLNAFFDIDSIIEGANKNLETSPTVMLTMPMQSWNHA